MNISVGGVIEIQSLPVAVTLKFTVHVVQSFIKLKGTQKIWSDSKRDITNRISPLTVE